MASPAPPCWVVLDRVALVLPEDADAEGSGAAATTSLSLPAPPRVARLVFPAELHPDPAAPDARPYVLAADTDTGLLLNLARGPLTGFDLALRPQAASSLVLLRGFLPQQPRAVAGGQRDARCAATSVVRIPDRPAPRVVSCLKSLGLVSNPGSGGADYIVAELRVDPGIHHANLAFFRSGAAAWAEKKLVRPEMPGRTCLQWGWDSDDVVSHDGKLWWIDLKRGLLSCNPFDKHPVLRLDEFPEAISQDYQFKSDRLVEADRCVMLSRDRLRYVELTRAVTDPPGSTLIVMWTLVTSNLDGMSWWKNRSVTSIQQIWASPEYKSSKMPETIPVLASISPINPDHVFFFLDQYLFLADVLEARLIGFAVHELTSLPTPHPPISWRYVVAWELPPSLITRVLTGHYCRESLMLRSETTKLRSSQFALMIEGETLKRLKEGLLHRSEEDSSWKKTQIVLFAALIGGLTCLFQFWQWIPKDFLAPIVFAFGAVWVLGCVAVPFKLFGSRRWEIRFGHHTVRAALMCFSVFVLYGLHQMYVIPVPGSGDSIAPSPAVSVSPSWGWFDISFAWLAVFALCGQLYSWISNDCARKAVDSYDGCEAPRAKHPLIGSSSIDQPK